MKFKHPQHKGSSVTEPASKSFPVPHPALLPNPAPEQQLLKEQERKCAATDLLLPGPELEEGGAGVNLNEVGLVHDTRHFKYWANLSGTSFHVRAIRIVM